MERLELNGLKQLTDVQAEWLAQFDSADCWLTMNGLDELTDSQAESLSKFKWKYLIPEGICSLTDAQAESFSKFKGKYLRLGLHLSDCSEYQQKLLSKVLF